ncbi:MAG: glycoside hydrolase family 26 protein [Syntrophales bacterium]
MRSRILRSERLGMVLIALLALAAPAEAAERPFWGFTLDGFPITAERLADVEKQTGLSARMVVLFLQWPAPGEPLLFPEGSLDAIRSQEAMPCLTWEPMYYREGRETTVSAESILSGGYDAYLNDFAARARAWGKPFVIRLAHEMNLDRYHWGTDGAGYGPASPELYRRMFRHIVEIFRRRGATNVQWAFCPNAESVPHRSYDPSACWNTPEAYYPGDDWVDILGMDGYNWGNTRTMKKDGWESRWRSFREIFEPLYRTFRQLAPGKPIVVFETATVSAGGDRCRWIREALETATAWDLRGICWFQVDKETDWRLDVHRDAAGVEIVRRGTAHAEKGTGTMEDGK